LATIAIYLCCMKGMRAVGLILLLLLPAGTLFGQQGLMMTAFYDSLRSKEIPVDIFYPSEYPGVNARARKGLHPVVVFGHAMAIPVQSYRHIVSNFGQQGYIVVLPKTEMSMTPALEEFSSDIAFCAEELLRKSIEEPGFLLHGKVARRFAAVGHSLGGSSAIWAATRTDLFQTVVAMAPPEVEPFPSIAAATLSIPVLVITGTKDGVTSMEDHVMPVFLALASPCKMLIGIKGGSHCGFSNSNWLCNLGESLLAPSSFIPRKDQHIITHTYIAPWLKYFLFDECKGLPALVHNALNDERVDIVDDCSILISPCVDIDRDMLRLEASVGNIQWMLNGEAISGEHFQTVALGHGAGVYQCTIDLGNGCSIRSEEFWHHSGMREARGNLHYRFYRPVDQSELNFEIFGKDIPVHLDVFDSSGKRVLAEHVSENRQTYQLPANTRGILHYSLSKKEVVLSRGKILMD